MTRRPALSVLFAISILTAVTAGAQEAKTIEAGPWKFGSTAGLTLSQSSFSSRYNMSKESAGVARVLLKAEDRADWGTLWEEPRSFPWMRQFEPADAEHRVVDFEDLVR